MTGADARGRRLVGIARHAIAAGEGGPPAWSEAWLLEPAATFVTLTRAGELRGCIGTLEARRTLGDDVWRNAQSAAFRDPRFPPVTPAEVAALAVEVSVLSSRVPFAAASEDEALRALRPGIDGLYLEFGARGATFLPQVWESLPEPRDFVAHLKRKAGLPADFWDPGVRLSRYTVEKFT